MSSFEERLKSLSSSKLVSLGKSMEQQTALPWGGGELKAVQSTYKKIKKARAVKKAQKKASPGIGIAQVNTVDKLATGFSPIRWAKTKTDHVLKYVWETKIGVKYKIDERFLLLLPCRKRKSYQWDTLLKEYSLKSYLSLSNGGGVFPKVMAPRLTGLDAEFIPELVYENMKSQDTKNIALSYVEYLKTETEPKYIFSVGIGIASIIITELGDGSLPTPTSFKKAIYNVYTLNGGHKLMVLPNVLQMNVLEDTGFLFLNELYWLIQNNTTKEKLPEVTIIESEETLIKMMEEYKDKKVGIDIETSQLRSRYLTSNILSVGISDGKTAYAFLVDHPLYPTEIHISWLEKVLYHNEFTLLILQNGKFDFSFFFHYFKDRLVKTPISDTILLDHYLNETGSKFPAKLHVSYYSMGAQIRRYLGVESHKDMNAAYTKQKAELTPEQKLRSKKAAEMSWEEVTALVDLVSKPAKPDYGPYTYIPKRELLIYNGLDSYRTKQIYNVQRKRIRQEGNPKESLFKVWSNQVQFIAHMEHNGAPMNLEFIRAQLVKAFKLEKFYLQKVLDKVSSEKWAAVNAGDFKLTSDVQLVNYLLEVEKVPRELLTLDSNGELSTDKKHLKRASEKASWLKDYLKYRQSLKAKNTYLIPMLQHTYTTPLYKNSDNIQASLFFKLIPNGTATGRLASNDPNLQNLPVSFFKKTSEEIQIKACIQAPERFSFADFDYATVEVKVLTFKSYCPDSNLVSAIRNGDDIHCLTASKVFDGVDYSLILNAKRKSDAHSSLTPKEIELLDYRQMAKSAIFGTVYGITASKFQENVSWLKGETEQEHLSRSDNILTDLKTKAYPELLKMFTRNEKTLLMVGFGRTIFGRRRRFHRNLGHVYYKLLSDTTGLTKAKMYSSLKRTVGGRSFRQLGNFLVQSTASDILQTFLGGLITSPEFSDIGLHLVAQVHDSVIFYFFTDKEAELKRVVKQKAEVEIKQLVAEEMLIPKIGHAIDIGRGYHLN